MALEVVSPLLNLTLYPKLMLVPGSAGTWLPESLATMKPPPVMEFVPSGLETVTTASSAEAFRV